ncbi:MAG: hypothetical protein HPY66_1191 [Firmicutes bacterium]|nr:hypothetical protein [Bacillota bacterium]MDI6705495.1 hypothetical protein [Bacillota bacterium]
MVTEVIKKYRNILNNSLYVNDNTAMCGVFLFFGGISFVRIGYMAFRNDFLKMYRYYCRKFILEWSETDESLSFSKISIKCVFEVMLKNESIVINYGFKPILQQIDNTQIFYEILEEEYYSFWSEKVQQCLRENTALSVISRKIGVSDTVKCCMDYHLQLKM